MPAQSDLSRVSIRQFAERFRGEMIPLSNTIAYFCASLPLSEEDLEEYLEEPVAALPPAISSALPRISILLVPYIESQKARVGMQAASYISMEKPPLGRTSTATHLRLGDETVLVFALKDQEIAEYHYRFYHLLASVIAENWSETQETSYSALLQEELAADANGEVDEPSWRMKHALRRAKGAATKQFSAYAKQSFIDTLTLYLHGICCDIDVDTGPRQLPSRYLRKRLLALQTMFPPPKGYVIFPEQLEH